MVNVPTAEELLGGRGGTSWKPEVAGDKVVGIILSQEVKQQTEPRKKGSSAPVKLRTYEDGSPMYQIIFRLQTDEIDDEIEDDDGVRVVFANYELQKAIRLACQAAGIKPPTTAIGGKLLCKVSGFHDNPYGGKDVREYVAKYKAPDPVADQLAETDDEPGFEPEQPKAAKKAPAKKAAAKSASLTEDDDEPGF